MHTRQTGTSGTGALLSVVIVSRGMAPMLDLSLRCLRASLDQWRGRGVGGVSVVVVDNASPEPLRPDDDGARVIRFDAHHSFASACNAGARAVPADAYLMLNNDCFLHPRAVAALATTAHAERVGIVGARLVYPNGTIQHAGIRFGPEAVGPYHDGRGKASSSVPRIAQEWQAVTGACMWINGTCWDDLGGFDETYAFAWEDVDFCLRARQRGWRVLCDQSVDSIHLESMTPGRMEKDPPSREAFLARWRGKWAVDG